MGFFRRLVKRPDPSIATPGHGEPSDFVAVEQTSGSPAFQDDLNSGTPAAPEAGEPAFQDDLNDSGGPSSPDGPDDVVGANPGPPEDGAILVVSAADGPMPDGGDFDNDEHSTLVDLGPTDFEGNDSMLVHLDPHESFYVDDTGVLLPDGEDDGPGADDMSDI